MSTFSELLEAHRKKKHISVSEAARRAKVEIFTYTSWESGLTMPSREDVVRIFGEGSPLERHLPASSRKTQHFDVHPLPARPHRSIEEQSFSTPGMMGAALEKVGLAKPGALTKVSDVVASIPKPVATVYAPMISPPPDVILSIPKPVSAPRHVSIQPLITPPPVASAPPPAEDPWIAFGKEITKSLEESGLSAPEFAAMFGVQVATLRHWESGRAPGEASLEIIRSLVPSIKAMNLVGTKYGRKPGALNMRTRERAVATVRTVDPSLPKDPWEAFCVILKRQRKFRLLSQLEFAELVPVSAGMISQWEVGVLKPTAEHLPRLIELCPALAELDLSDAPAAPLGLVAIDVVVENPKPIIKDPESVVSKPVLSSDPLDVVDRVQAAFESLGRVVTYQPTRNKGGAVARLIENENSIAVGSGFTSSDALQRMLEDLRAGFRVDCDAAAEDMRKAADRHAARVADLKALDAALGFVA